MNVGGACFEFLLKCKINIVGTCLIAEDSGVSQMCIVSKNKHTGLVENFNSYEVVFTPPEHATHIRAKSNTVNGAEEYGKT
jgi:hypothetical protein